MRLLKGVPSLVAFKVSILVQLKAHSLSVYYRGIIASCSESVLSIWPSKTINSLYSRIQFVVYVSQRSQERWKSFVGRRLCVCMCLWVMGDYL